MSTYKAAITVCGLSQQAAAEFHGVNLDTIKSWCAGRRDPPHGVWVMLANLFCQIAEAADKAAETMSLDGIDPRAYNNLEAALTNDPLPTIGAMKAAGAMALLMAIAEK